MNTAKRILEFITPYDQTDRYGSRVGVAEHGQGDFGFDIKSVVREYAMSVLNVNYDKAESFSMEVAKHLVAGDWLEIHIPGHSVQWNRNERSKK